jgi:hypothetical protein
MKVWKPLLKWEPGYLADLLEVNKMLSSSSQHVAIKIVNCQIDKGTDESLVAAL